MRNEQHNEQIHSDTAAAMLPEGYLEVPLKDPEPPVLHEIEYRKLGAGAAVAFSIVAMSGSPASAAELPKPTPIIQEASPTLTTAKEDPATTTEPQAPDDSAEQAPKDDVETKPDSSASGPLPLPEVPEILKPVAETPTTTTTTKPLPTADQQAFQKDLKEHPEKAKQLGDYLQSVAQKEQHDADIRYYATMDRATVNQRLLDAVNKGALAFENTPAGRGASLDITNSLTFSDRGARMLLMDVEKSGTGQFMISSINTGRSDCPNGGSEHCPADGSPGSAFDRAGSNGADLAASHAYTYRNQHELVGELIYGHPSPGTHNMDYVIAAGGVEDCDSCYDEETLRNHDDHVHESAKSNPDIAATPAVPTPQPVAETTPVTPPVSSEPTSYTMLPEPETLQYIPSSPLSDTFFMTIPTVTADASEALETGTIPLGRTTALEKAAPFTPQQQDGIDRYVEGVKQAEITRYVEAVKQEELNRYLQSLKPTNQPPYSNQTSVLGDDGIGVAGYNKILKGSGCEGMGQDFQDFENKFGIMGNYAIADVFVESARCTSNFAQERGNLTGIQAYDSNPDAAATYGSKRGGLFAFGHLLVDHYLYPGEDHYYGTTISAIETDYSTSTTKEFTVAELMNEFENYART